MVWGFVILLLGAICGGSFGLPSKYAPKDTPWENLWGPFFLFVTVLIPVILGPLLVKDFYAIFCAADRHALLMTLAFGFLWGLGSMTLGMSFAFIGLSLAYSLNYGAQIIFGSMAPLLIFNRSQIFTARGGVILIGVAVCLLGVVVCGRAALLKEQSLKGNKPAETTAPARQPKMLIGVAVGIVSGILCACYAVAANYAVPVQTLAQTRFGNAPWHAAFAGMSLILWGGAVSSCLYCIVQLTRHKTWGNFTRPGVGRTLGLAGSMSLLHDGAILLFGLGFSKLAEDIGVSVGYAAFMSFAIIVGNVHGFRSGEWQGASRRSISWIVAGIIVLIAGVCILGHGNAMPKA